MNRPDHHVTATSTVSLPHPRSLGGALDRSVLDVGLPDWGLLDSGVVRLLAQRYGDGQVYLHDGDDPRPYHRAVSLGLVGTDGYLTAAGYSLVSRYRG